MALQGTLFPPGDRRTPKSCRLSRALRRLLQVLEQFLVRRVIAEPFLTAADQRLAASHASGIDAMRSPKSNRNRVTFGIFRITGLQDLGADCDGELVAFV